MNGRGRFAFVLSALGGLALAIFLVVWFGADSVLKALAAIGWSGLALIALLHLVPMSFCGAAWRSVMPPPDCVRLPIVIAARILRDAGAELLPISPAGGAVMGARALILARMKGSMAFATTVVDLTMEVSAQLVFTCLGVLVLLRAGAAPQFGTMALIGLGVGVAATFGFLVAQRVGLFLLLERLTERVARGNAAWRPSGSGVHDSIRALYRRRAGIAVALACHLCAWSATAVESWVALRLIGHPLPFAAVFMVSSLVLALRSAAFLVPSGWGVQEGGFVVLGALVGLPASTALGLSLALRARELTLGVPALMLWQAIETRHLRRALP